MSYKNGEIVRRDVLYDRFKNTKEHEPPKKRFRRLSHWTDSVLAFFGKRNEAERVFLYNAKKLYNKALSGGTALKKQTEHRDVSAGFNTRRQELETMLADGQITDEEYESGIEVLNEEQLLQEGRTEPRQTKIKPPARQETPTDGVKHLYSDSQTGISKTDISEDDKQLGEEIAGFIESVNAMFNESLRSKRKRKIGEISNTHVKIINDLMRQVYP